MALTSNFEQEYTGILWHVWTLLQGFYRSTCTLLQTILTEIPTPVSAAWVDTLHSFRRHSRGGTEYPVALQEAYQSIGLLREVCIHDNKRQALPHPP